MTHFRPTERQPTEYGQSRDEREATVLCMREHRASWVVVARHCNHSAFNGYHYTPSDWSGIKCLDCGRYWRTKAEYVTALPNAPRS
jgi:hypothetical protein